MKNTGIWLFSALLLGILKSTLKMKTDILSPKMDRSQVMFQTEGKKAWLNRIE